MRTHTQTHTLCLKGYYPQMYRLSGYRIKELYSEYTSSICNSSVKRQMTQMRTGKRLKQISLQRWEWTAEDHREVLSIWLQQKHMAARMRHCFTAMRIKTRQPSGSRHLPATHAYTCPALWVPQWPGAIWPWWSTKSSAGWKTEANSRPFNSETSTTLTLAVSHPVPDLQTNSSKNFFFLQWPDKRAVFKAIIICILKGSSAMAFRGVYTLIPTVYNCLTPCQKCLCWCDQRFWDED